MINSTRQPHLLYISSIPISPTGGGLFSVNWNILKQLEQHFPEVSRAFVPTPSDFLQSITSKIQRRLLKVPSKFHTFSPKVLKSIAQEVNKLITKNVDALFFRSSTRWIGYKPGVPYFVHTDMPFSAFVKNTFSQSLFLQTDLNRIYQQEAEFLDKAQAVFFESNWGLEKTKQTYCIKGDNFIVTPNGGNTVIPDRDSWTGDSMKILTIAKDFFQKGGDLVLEAFRILRPRYPQLEWHIIGNPPKHPIVDSERIHVEGFLRSTNPDEKRRFQTLLEQAFLLVHPTREDCNPLVLVEAAYFGCPSVSVEDFAIPELVIHGRTGLLIPRPVSGAEVAEKIEELILSENYLQYRKNARDYSTKTFSWEKSGNVIADHINKQLLQKFVQ